MPCCGGHGDSVKPSREPFLPTNHGITGDALQNLSVLKTLSEHVDAATAVSCYSVCKAWREAFGWSIQDSALSATEPLDGTRSRFVANLHGAVTLEVTHPPAKSQRGFDRHLLALSKNRHLQQLKVHLPIREAADPQLALSGLSSLSPLTQLTSLVVTRNPTFTSAPHNLSEEDIAALGHMRSLTFLELCAAVPPALGLSQLASLATGPLTQLRTLAFGHASQLWRVPQISALCTLLDVCPFLTDLRLRCCVPPRDPQQLPALMGLPLPQRLTNFALTFVRRLPRDDLAAGGGGGAAAANGGGGEEDDGQFGEYEDPEDRWDSVDHLAPKPGLHVLIVEKGTRVTRMDVNVCVSVTASDLPTVPPPGRRRRQQHGGDRARPRTRRRAGWARGPSALLRAAMSSQRSFSDDSSDSDEASEGEGSGGRRQGRRRGGAAAAAGDGGGGSGDDEEDVPPYDVTPMVLAEYKRLLNEELGLTGTLAEPEDLHLGVRLDILEDEEGGAAAAAAAALHNPFNPAAAPANPPGGGGGLGVMLHAALQHLQQAQAQMQQQQQAGAAAGAAGGGEGGGGGGGLPAALAALLNQLGNMQLGGGGGAAGAGAGAGGAGGAAAARRLTFPLPARALQLHLGPLSEHMCYLNIALVPMVTQLAVVGAGPNGEELVQPQPPLDTRVAPVLLDVRGAGYTQLKSLAITGFIDQDCNPATWMSRGWLSRLPTGMPSLEFLAFYDSLPAGTHDPTAIQGLRSLSRLEHLEMRPLYLRFTGEVRNPMTVPPTALPSTLQQLTLKKVNVTAALPPPAAAPKAAATTAVAATAAAAGAGATAGGSAASGSAASARLPGGLPDLSHLTNLWLFDCDAADLTAFRSASRLEDLRLGGTTTLTRLPDLVAHLPCLRCVILDVCRTTAPGWWSARQLSSLAALRCLRTLQLDAASMEPPPRAPKASKRKAKKAGKGKPASTTGAASAAAPAPSPAPAAVAATAQAASDDDSEAYHSTQEGDAAANGGGPAAAGVGASGSATRDGYGKDGELGSVLAAIAGLTQLTELTLSFDSPTLYYNPEDEEEEEEEEGEEAHGHASDPDDGDEEDGEGDSDDSDDDSDDSDDDSDEGDVSKRSKPRRPAWGGDTSDSDPDGSGDSSLSSVGSAARGAPYPAAAGAGAAAAAGGPGPGSSDSSSSDEDAEPEPERDHNSRVVEGLLSGQSLVTLAALQGLWRLRVGLPRGTVWDDVMARMLPALQLAMPRTAVDMDTL